MNKCIEILLCIHVSTRVKVHEKNFNKFFETKWRCRISRKEIRFFWRLDHYRSQFAPRTKNEKDSENIYKNKVSIVRFFEISISLIEKTVSENSKVEAIFRKIEISKNSTMLTLFLYRGDWGKADPLRK